MRISSWTEVINLLDNNIDAAAELDLTEYSRHKTESAKNTAGKDLSFSEFCAALNAVPSQNETGCGGGDTGGGGTKGSSAPISNASVSVVYPPDNSSESESSGEFTDLNGYEWAADGIKALAAAGVVKGVGSGRFEPARTITREEFAAIITRAFNIPAAKHSADFQDVTVSSWYNEPIAAVCEYGIANGVGHGFFGVGNDITRQDLCVMLHRALEKSEFVFSGEDTDFTDRADIAAYAGEEVGKMKHYGFISGFEDGSFKPALSATRAQAAKIIFGILGKKEYKNFTYHFHKNEKIMNKEVLLSADVIYNNVFSDKLSDADYVPSDGYTELTDTDRDGKYDLVKIISYTTVVTGYYDSEEDMLYDKLSSVKTDLSGKVKISDGEKEIDRQKLSENDVLLFAISHDGENAEGAAFKKYRKR